MDTKAFLDAVLPDEGRRCIGALRGGVFQNIFQADNAAAEAMALKVDAAGKDAYIALAGFNVVDVHRLHATLGVPVVVAVRRNPRLQMVKDALLDRTPGGARKWKLVQAAGPLTQLGPMWVQHIGLAADDARALLRATTLHGNVPEPLRLAHLIAGGVTTGQSRGRA